MIFHPEATKLIVSRRHWNILEPDLYRKVGYSEEAVAALMALASTTTVAPGTDGVEYPALSVANVSSIASAAYKSKHFGNKYAHVFWGKADLWPHAVLPFAMGTSHARTRHRKRGLNVQGLQRFLERGNGRLQICPIHRTAPRPACLLAAHFGRAPGEALNQLVKSRLEFYKRFEPTAAARDVALLVDPALTNRFLFS